MDTLETTIPDEELVAPQPPTEVETGIEAEQEEIPDEVVEEIGPAIEATAQAAGLELEPSDLDQIMGKVSQILKMEGSEQAQAYQKLFDDEPRLKQLLGEMGTVQEAVRQIAPELFQKKANGEGQQPASQESSEKGGEPPKTPEQLQEEAENLQKHAEKGTTQEIQKRIKVIMSDDKNQPEEQERLVREYLQQVKLSPEATEEIVAAIAAEVDPEQRVQQVNAIIEKHVKANPAVVEGVVDDIKDVKRLMDKINNLGTDKTRTEEYRSLYESMNKATDELMDELPVEDFIDMVFAVGRGYGGFRGGRYDKWGESSEDEKEKETLKTLGEVFDEDENPDGAKEFFAKLTDTTAEEVFTDKSLLRNLESILSSIESSQNPDEARKEVKKKISEALEAAGKKLEPEKINLSQDVLKYILIKAKGISRGK